MCAEFTVGVGATSQEFHTTEPNDQANSWAPASVWRADVDQTVRHVCFGTWHGLAYEVATAEAAGRGH